MAFQGFPAAAFEFYDGLEADNTRAFWQANRDTFETCVKGPMEALCAELVDADDAGDASFHLFRPYNDMRFAKNRPPYKTHQGAFRDTDGGAGQYLHLGGDGMLAGAGYYSMAKDQLARFRAAVDAERTGTDVAEIVAGLAGSGYSIGAMDELKSAPRGYPKDHPRIELLRRKGLMASRSWPVARWMRTAEAVARVREALAGIEPLCTWLDAHVGPSTLPPDDAWGR
ncbi:MAG: DUF2461 domain-containing protein [Ilumatobacteraceae bacterium]